MLSTLHCPYSQILRICIWYRITNLNKKQDQITISINLWLFYSIYNKHYHPPATTTTCFYIEVYSVNMLEVTATTSTAKLCFRTVLDIFDQRSVRTIPEVSFHQVDVHNDNEMHGVRKHSYLPTHWSTEVSYRL